MNHQNPAEINRGRLFRVRPIFLLALAAFLSVVTLPDLVRGSHTLKLIFLLLATLAVLSGWVFLLRDRDPRGGRRVLVALITSVYLTASVPTFLFEMSQIRWLIRHPMHRIFEAYVWPWAHWGLLFVLLGVAGSLFGHGRARTAFFIGSILLLILWASTGTWVW